MHDNAYWRTRLRVVGFFCALAMAWLAFFWIVDLMHTPPRGRLHAGIAAAIALALLVSGFRFIRGRFGRWIIAFDFVFLAVVAGFIYPYAVHFRLPESEAKRTMRDLRELSNALDQFKSQRDQYPEARTLEELEAQLTPTYLRVIPRRDRWNHSLRYEAWKEKADDAGPQHYSIGSPGADGKFEKEPLRTRVLEAARNDGADIVLTDGRFVSTPEPQADQTPAALAGAAETQTAGGVEPELLFAQATALYRNNDYDRAIPLFQQFLAAKPDHALATARLAASFCQSGRLDDAIPALRRAIELNPSDYQSHANMALTYHRLYKSELAVEPALAAVKLQPENSDVLNVLGLVLTAAGHPEAAIEPLEKAVRVNPDNMMALYNLGVAFHRVGKDERAVRALKVLELRDPARAKDLRVELSR